MKIMNGGFRNKEKNKFKGNHEGRVAVLGSLVAFVSSCVVLGKSCVFPSHLQVWYVQASTPRC